MGKFFRWFLLFIAVLVLTAIFEPPLMDMFRAWGWHETPENIPGDVVNWLEGIVGQGAFPWVAAGSFGLASGVWLQFLANKFDRNHIPYAVRLRQELKELSTDIAFGGQYHLRQPEIMSRYEILAGKLSALGIPTKPLPSSWPEFDLSWTDLSRTYVKIRLRI